ncbi:ATP-dependent DNA ligase [Streptomyces sp. YIM 98790]|uniref:ATP-dependent DNA ligase n=1 Tax=Streptomyces sp. YIM 98790 TaxID=2689077 RepID=UPI001A9EA4FB|nr:ATP-dependent DNA ligase [Streptomyces sp. YIM 98790]
MVVFRTAGGVLLQTRSGRLAGGLFPDLTGPAMALPAGTVLDGEVVVWREGRCGSGAVQRRALSAPGPGRRPRRGTARLLRRLRPSRGAGEDLRPLSCRRRRERLVALLEPLGPPLQAVPRTTGRELARTWYGTMGAAGAEGLVVRPVGAPYRAGARGGWKKRRHADTLDAAVTGVSGAPAHPRALVLGIVGDVRRAGSEREIAHAVRSPSASGPASPPPAATASARKTPCPGGPCG